MVEPSKKSGQKIRNPAVLEKECGTLDNIQEESGQKIRNPAVFGKEVRQIDNIPNKWIRISVAVVTYNGELFLEEQLDSILRQLEENDEVVISDDGSKDNTLKIIKAYQEKYPCIRLVQGPQKGIKKNVENALRHCNGNYIFLADQDDIWVENKVENVLQLFQERGASLVIHDAIVFGDDMTRPVMTSFFEFRQAGAGVLKNIMKNSYIGCCMAFRRELLQKALPIPDYIEMHDQWFGVLNDFYFEKSCFYKKSLLYYRRHGENNSNMTHYGVGKMIKNRVLFVVAFVKKIVTMKVRNS